MAHGYLYENLRFHITTDFYYRSDTTFYVVRSGKKQKADRIHGIYSFKAEDLIEFTSMNWAQRWKTIGFRKHGYWQNNNTLCLTALFEQLRFDSGKRPY